MRLFACAGLPQTKSVAIARLKKGVVITAAILGSAAFLFLCVLVWYRRKMKRQQTVYPAAQNPSAEGCWDGADSDSEGSHSSS